MLARSLVLVLALALGACASALSDTHPFTELPTRPTGPHVEMQYLGNGGWLIQRGKDRIATAPFVTNPNGLTLFFPRKPDTERIKTEIPAMDDVEIILIGHGHYDHAMDLPELVPMKAPEATIYGSTSVMNTLSGAPTLKPKNLRAIEPAEIAHGDRPGKWLENKAGTIRVMPLRSTHAPHFLGVKLLPKSNVEEKQTKLPCCPQWWHEGDTFAFIIDFLDDKKNVDFRIYYQDSASEPGTGIAPVFEGVHAARIDVAILCVAAFNQVDGNPEHILSNLQPRALIGGHWEDFFFQSYADPMRPAFLTSVNDFHARARTILTSKEPIYLPKRKDRVYLEIRPR